MMHFIKNTLSILLVFVFSTAFTQNGKAEIESDFTDYVNLLINQDFEKSVDYIPESFFLILPKETLLTAMKQAFNNPDMVIKLKDPKILKVRNIEKIEEKHYSKLTYSNIMEMKSIGEEDEEEDEKEMRLALIKMGLDKSFGSKNVEYNAETEYFTIYVEKDVYAISENGETNWKFLTIEKKQKEILNLLLPKKLADKI